MILGWLKRRRQHREAIGAEAARLVAAHGALALGEAQSALLDAQGDRRRIEFASEVVTEVRRLMGLTGRADTATRMLYRED